MPGELLSTPLDTYNKFVNLVSDTGEYAGTWERSQAAIQNVISITDGIIRASLKLTYGTTLTSSDAIEAGFPQSWSGNTGSGTIRLATADTTNTITQMFTLTYDDSGYYTVVGGITGSDGNCYTNTTFTGSYLSIDTAHHGGTPSDGDVIYIPTYKNEKLLVEISSNLATAAILQSVFIAEMPNAEEFSEVLKRHALSLLKSLVSSNSDMELVTISRTSRNINPIMQPFVIDEFGTDVTRYASDEFSATVGAYPWW